MNYIIKSVIEMNESGAKVEKLTAKRPALAIEIYKSQVLKGFQPAIYKKVGTEWIEIKLSQLVEEKNLKIKGQKCPFRINL